MLVISERIGARERSETEVTVYYNNLEEIRISGRMPRSGNRSTFRRPGAGFPTGRSSARALDVKDLQMDVTGKSVVV